METVIQQPTTLPELNTHARLSTSFLRLLAIAFSMLFDLFAIASGIFASRVAFTLLHSGRWPGHLETALAVLIECWLSYTFLAHSHRLFDPSPRLLEVRTSENVLRISCFCGMILFLQLFLSHSVIPRLPFIFGWFLSALLLLVGKHLSRKLLVLLHKLHRIGKSVVIVGIGSDARRIYSYLRDSPYLGITNIFFINEDEPNGLDAIFSHDYKHRWYAPVLHQKLDAALLDSLGISEVFAADLQLSNQRLAELFPITVERGISLYNVQASSPMYSGAVGYMDGMPLVRYSLLPLARPIYGPAKRCLDIIVASLMLVISAPAMLLVALLVRLSSEGPVLFRQERVGYMGKQFTILKFRSMYLHAPLYGRSPESSHDSRVTPVGRFLRKTSLDELPQLINVLRGDMSLVGPRPEMSYVAAQYSAKERRRLSVPQGLTGLWQLSADRRFSIHKNIEYDFYYVDNRGFFLDLAIILHTILFAAKGL